MPQTNFAIEADYGVTPSTGWRTLDPASDEHKSIQETLQHRGISASSGVPQASGRRIVDRGGEASIDIPGQSNGLGVLLQAGASDVDVTAVPATSLSFEHVYEFLGGGSNPEDTSFAAEFTRERRDGTPDWWRYGGGKLTQIDVTQDTSGLLMFKLAVNYLTAARLESDPARTPVDVDPDLLFAWPDALITLTPLEGSESGNDECVSSFNLTIPLAVDTDDYCLKKGTNKHEPQRMGLSAATGTLEWRYQHPRYYDAFRSGALFSLSAFWEGSTAIEGSTFPSLLIEVPIIAFSGEDPQASVDAPITQSLPFEILGDDSEAPVTFTFVTTDDEV